MKILAKDRLVGNDEIWETFVEWVGDVTDRAEDSGPSEGVWGTYKVSGEEVLEVGIYKKGAGYEASLLMMPALKEERQYAHSIRSKDAAAIYKELDKFKADSKKDFQNRLKEDIEEVKLQLIHLEYLHKVANKL